MWGALLLGRLLWYDDCVGGWVGEWMGGWVGGYVCVMCVVLMGSVVPCYICMCSDDIHPSYQTHKERKHTPVYATHRYYTPTHHHYTHTPHTHTTKTNTYKTQVAWAFARLQHQPATPIMERVVDVVATHATTMNPKAVANAMWALGKLEYQPHAAAQQVCVCVGGWVGG